jgi:hypothetical protein
MHKDTIPTPMEPFTDDEQAALFARLDGLSVTELEAYIGSARNSLQNRALAPTWRPRIEVALRRAEAAHLRQEAAAAELAAAAPVVAPPAPKAKKA